MGVLVGNGLRTDCESAVIPRELKVGDVVQLNPETVGNKAFAGAFMVVTEPKSWGAQGYVESIGSDAVASVKGAAYFRAKWEAMEYIGVAEFVRARDTEEEPQ